ncbi:SDR family oxidoreductase, partial [Escherichia coli]|nr:SDR family oxidoreductase [Escherichia coli]
MKLLLLTGATGFLGGAVLDKLLDNCNNINLLLLVRAPTPEPRQPGGCKLKTAPVRPVVAARPAE